MNGTAFRATYRTMRNAVLGLTLLALAPAIAVAGPARQFDLDCSGTVSTLDGDAAPWSGRFSIDLDAKAWCERPCTALKRINRVEPGQIWLRDDRTPEDRDPRLAAMFVDRTTGALAGQDAGVAHAYHASCAIAAFTPLPKTLF